MNNKLIDRGAVMIDYLERLGRADSYKAKYEALAAAIDFIQGADGGRPKYCPECGARMDGGAEKR